MSHEKVETKNTLIVKARSREAEDALEAANTKINELTCLYDDVLNKQRVADGEHGKLLHENEHLKLRLLESDKKIKEVKKNFKNLACLQFLHLTIHFY